MELLKSHPWSGNIRAPELYRKAVILSEGAVLTPKEVELKSIQSDSGVEISSEDSLEETEKKAIMAAIGRFGETCQWLPNLWESAGRHSTLS